MRALLSRRFTVLTDLRSQGIFTGIELASDVVLLSDSVDVGDQEVEHDCGRQREGEHGEEEGDDLHHHFLGGVDWRSGLATTNHLMLQPATDAHHQHQNQVGEGVGDTLTTQHFASGA